MANEASVQWSLQITKGSMKEPLTGSFRADVLGTKGPTPGAILVATTGTDIDLSQLVQPGLYAITNLEPAGGNYVEYGIRDPETDRFYPWGELLPAESLPGRFSRNVGEEYAPATGTGTTGPTNRVHFKAHGAPVVVQVKAFEA